MRLFPSGGRGRHAPACCRLPRIGTYLGEVYPRDQLRTTRLAIVLFLTERVIEADAKEISSTSAWGCSGR